MRALTPADRRSLVEALGLLIVIRIALRVLPFTKVRGYLNRWAAKAQGPSPLALAIVWAVRAAASRLPPTTCLVEALAVHSMLRRYGYSPELKIGVRRGTVMSLDAHAWVECDGAIVIGTTPAIGDYAVLS